MSLQKSCPPKPLAKIILGNFCPNVHFHTAQSNFYWHEKQRHFEKPSLWHHEITTSHQCLDPISTPPNKVFLKLFSTVRLLVRYSKVSRIIVAFHRCYFSCFKSSLTYIYIYTSTGRKFALVEGLSHDLVCAGSNYHVHFAWQVWHGQYSPRFKSNKLKSFARVEIDRNHVDLKDSRGKGFCSRTTQQA